MAADFEKMMQESKAIVEITFDQLGYPELTKLTEVSWNNRLINVMGDAKLTKVYSPPSYGTQQSTLPKFKGKIRLSSKVFSIADESERVETAVHEACHIVDSYLRYEKPGYSYTDFKYKKSQGHGIHWIDLMKQMGYKTPQPCHFIDVSRFKKRYDIACRQCGKNFNISAQRAGRMVNGTSSYACNVCHKILWAPDLKLATKV